MFDMVLDTPLLGTFPQFTCHFVIPVDMDKNCAEVKKI